MKSVNRTGRFPPAEGVGWKYPNSFQILEEKKSNPSSKEAQSDFLRDRIYEKESILKAV